MNRAFAFILIFAMVAGIAAGWFVNSYFPAAKAAEIADSLSILTDLFLRLIKMIIAPLVFATLVAGIAHMEDAAAIGRVADGVVVGSAIIDLIAANGADAPAAVRTYIQSLSAALAEARKEPA